MTQNELNHAVADLTGEDHETIRSRGFNLVDVGLIDFDPEPNDLPAMVVDWDADQSTGGATIDYSQVA